MDTPCGPSTGSIVSAPAISSVTIGGAGVVVVEVARLAPFDGLPHRQLRCRSPRARRRAAGADRCRGAARRGRHGGRIRDQGQDRVRRDGRGVPGVRPRARTDDRAQAAPQLGARQRHAAAASGGQDDGEALPPERADDLRGRHAPGPGLHRDGVRARRHASPLAACAPNVARDRRPVRLRGPRPRRRPRRGLGPSRLQGRQRAARHARAPPRRGLRPRPRPGWRSGGVDPGRDADRLHAGRLGPAHDRGHGGRDRSLHAARAVRVRGRARERGSVCVVRQPLRGAVRSRPVRRVEHAGAPHQDPRRGSSAARAHPRPGSDLRDPAARPRGGSRRSLPEHGGAARRSRSKPASETLEARARGRTHRDRGRRRTTRRRRAGGPVCRGRGADRRDVEPGPA